MEPFTTLQATAAPLPVDDVNTDAIFPGHFVQRLDVDYAGACFASWRTRRDGETIADFVLNQSDYRDARILVAGRNFGCGSSREHAVWALKAFGIRCIIAKSYGDILYANCFKNGVLPIHLPDHEVEMLVDHLESTNDKRLTVDLVNRTIASPNGAIAIGFDIDAGRRMALLEGLDDIGLTLRHEGEIDAWQARDRANNAWKYAGLPGRKQ